MVVALVLLFIYSFSCRAEDRVTILYDAFGESKMLAKDWGFSALVEHDGKRILFDTGNNAEILEKNVKALGVELGQRDLAVISHRHADRATGLRYVLKVNPRCDRLCACRWCEWFRWSPRCQQLSCVLTMTCFPRCATSTASARRS